MIHGLLLDGKGGARRLARLQDFQTQLTDGVLWLHFDYSKKSAKSWLADSAGLDPVVSDILVSGETRPRCLVIQDSLLLVLRGVNLNHGSEPDDMIAIRIWADSKRIISSRARQLSSVQDIILRFEQKTGPLNSADWVCQIADRVVYRTSDIIDALEEKVSVLDDRLSKGYEHDIKHQLAIIRKQVVTLRRYLAPQREAFSRLLVKGSVGLLKGIVHSYERPWTN